MGPGTGVLMVQSVQKAYLLHCEPGVAFPPGRRLLPVPMSMSVLSISSRAVRSGSPACAFLRILSVNIVSDAGANRAKRPAVVLETKLPEAMDMLNNLPESVKGCLLEAARLCGTGASNAQMSLINQWHTKVFNPLPASPRFDSPSLPLIPHCSIRMQRHSC